MRNVLSRKTRVNAAIIAVLVLAVYGYVLDLLFFYDDLPILTWLSRHTWRDIWIQAEAGYYRPLAFTFFRLGMLLPIEGQRDLLHALNLVWLFIGALLVRDVCFLCTDHALQADIAAVFYAVFPFMSKAIPWVTAMGHPLAATLLLAAVYFALKAEKSHRPGWWGASLVMTALAPFAHEGGAVAAFVVGGVVLLQCGFRGGGLRRYASIGAGLALNILAVLWRSSLIEFRAIDTVTWEALYAKAMFFVHGLLYPVAPAVGWLVRSRGWHDFTLLALAAAVTLIIVGFLAHKTRSWRWFAQLIWWWGCAALPSVVFFNFAALYVAPRLYTLGAASAAMFWSAILVKASERLPRRWGRVLLWVLAAVIAVQGTGSIARDGKLFRMLDVLYDEVLAVAANADSHPVGFVNVPYQLKWNTATYPLVQEGVVFVPWYSDLGDFLAVNGVVAPPVNLEVVVYGPVVKFTDPTLLAEGERLDVEQMYAFAREKRALWLTQLDEARLELVMREVGHVTPLDATDRPPLVHFEGGPDIVAVAAEAVEPDTWAVTLEWASHGPVGAEIFVHVRDGTGALVVQADGPALGGLSPLWVWQAGDRVRDVRYFTVPAGAEPPYTVQVGIYNGDGRFSAFANGQRFPDDAATVIVIPDP